MPAVNEHLLHRSAEEVLLSGAGQIRDWDQHSVPQSIALHEESCLLWDLWGTPPSVLPDAEELRKGNSCGTAVSYGARLPVYAILKGA